MRRNVRGIAWLAWAGLFGPGMRFVTWVSIFSIIVIIVLFVDICGFIGGYYRVQSRILLEDPLSVCLWVGQPGFADQLFTAERLQAIEQTLRSSNKVQSWHPMHEIWLDVGLIHEPENTLQIVGRTMSDSDPVEVLFQSQAELSTGGSSHGIYLSTRMLKLIGWNQPGLPSELRIRGPTGLYTSVPVKGVLRRELPWNHQFVVDEICYQNYLEANRDERSSCVITGSVPQSWPSEFGRFPEVVRFAFDRYSLFPPRLEQSGNGQRWRMETYESGGLSKSQWSAYLKQIAKLMTEKGYEQAPEEFWQSLTMELPHTVTSEAPPYNLVVVYIKSVEYLREVKILLERGGFRVRDTNETISRMEHIYRSTVTAGVMLTGISLIIGLGFFLTLIGMHSLRVNSKLPQIGMLKAIGMSLKELKLLYICESIIIWGFAIATGLPTAYLVGWLASPWVVPGGRKYPDLAFHVPWQVILAISLFLAVSCVCINLLAARKAIAASPIETFQPH